jgi:hypothetical protein
VGDSEELVGRNRGETLVYGHPNGEDELVFIPEAEAKELAQLWEALRSATTWGEFNLSAPYKRLQEALELFGEGKPPGDDDAFDGEALVDSISWDWPPWPAQRMLEWVPADIQERFGDVGTSMVSGDALYIDEAAETGIVAALEQAGYRCMHDDELVARASGQT